MYGRLGREIMHHALRTHVRALEMNVAVVLYVV